MTNIIKNIGSNQLLLLVNMGVMFVMTPVLIKNMGDYDYGIFVLITAIAGYMSILDLGLSPAIARFISKYHAIQDTDNIKTIFSAALVLLTTIGSVLCALLFIIYLFYPYILSPGNEEENKYSVAFILTIFQIFFTFPRVGLMATLEGYHLFTVKNNISIFISVVASSLIVALINNHNGLELVLTVGLLTGLIKTIYYYIYIKHSLVISFTEINFDRLKKTMKVLLKFSIKSLAQGASAKIANHSDNIIISFFLGATNIVIYSLPNALLKQLFGIIGNIRMVYLPVFSGLYSRNNTDELIEVYLNITRLITSLTLLGLGSIFFLADNFIGMWIGAEYGDKVKSLIPFFVLYGAVYLYNPLDNQLVTACNEHGKFAKLAIYEVIINIFLSIILVTHYGLLGVVFSTFLSCLFVKHFRIRHVSKVLSISYFVLLSSPLHKLFFPTFLPILLLWYLDEYMITFFSFILLGVGIFLCWIILMIFFGLNQDEYEFFLIKTRKFLKH